VLEWVVVRVEMVQDAAEEVGACVRVEEGWKGAERVERVEEEGMEVEGDWKAVEEGWKVAEGGQREVVEEVVMVELVEQGQEELDDHREVVGQAQLLDRGT
jgi:hypothetical protein